jgi:hypothetical protein
VHKLLLLVALVGCGHAKATGPSWPEPSTTADDGGESIAPHPSAAYAAAVESSNDAADAKPAAEATTASTTPAANDDTPVATPAVSQPIVEDVFMSEEIIIEIED